MKPYFLVSLLVALVVFSCQKSEPDQVAAAVVDEPKPLEPPKTVATVNGTEITDHEVMIVATKGRAHHASPEQRAETLEQIIDGELMYQEGIKLGLDKDPGYQKILRDMEIHFKSSKRTEMMKRVYLSQIAPNTTVTEDEAQHYFEAHRKVMEKDFHLEMLRFAKKEDAARAAADLAKGVTFADVAKTVYTNVPKVSDRSPWDIGFQSWRQLPGEWLPVLATLKLGQVSKPFETHRGEMRILKLIETRPAEVPTFEEVKQLIINRLRSERASKMHDDHVKKLRETAQITFAK